MRVLIVLDNMNTGGIASSLRNLLPRLAELAECDLLVFDRDSVDASRIPERVRLLQPHPWLRLLGKSQAELSRCHLLQAAVRAVLVAVSRVFGGNAARRLLFRWLPSLEGYDLAVSYCQDVGLRTISTGCNHFVLEKVCAKCKAAFIHCDYSAFGGYHPRQEADYARFDRIVCVSEGCKNSFTDKFPKLTDKCRVVENFTNADHIRRRMEAGMHSYDRSVRNVVTVCRLGEEKGLLRAAEAFGRLRDEGKTNFHWSVVGDGPERPRLEAYLRSRGLERYVTLMGAVNEPYCHMAGADLFLLPSLHEAAPMVFGECCAVGTPILTTDTVSARELVESRGLGRVCPNSTEGLYGALLEFLEGALPSRIPAQRMDEIGGIAQRQLCRFLEEMGEMEHGR